jgi:hypothetical protein
MERALYVLYSVLTVRWQKTRRESDKARPQDRWIELYKILHKFRFIGVLGKIGGVDFSRMPFEIRNPA